MLTVDELKAALPKALQGNASQEFADKVNLIATDPDVAREVRNNFLTYSKVLTEGKYKSEDYLNAVMYCTFKLMGYTNKDSYIKTFPDRYQRLVAAGRTEKEISAYVAIFHKGKLVNTILEQAAIPMWLLNQDAYQKAINKELDIMANPDASYMVQHLAAAAILANLKQPEVKKIEMDIGLKNSGGLDELKESMAALAERQAQMIADGAGAKTISRIPLRGAPTEEEKAAAEVVVTQPQIQHKIDPVAAMEQLTKPTLFGTSPATKAPVVKPEPVKPVQEIAVPAVNYAKCCDSAIEDCVCVETDHIYLPTNEDVPKFKRASLFDDPAGMP